MEGSAVKKRRWGGGVVPFSLGPASQEQLIYILKTRRRRSLTRAQTPPELNDASAVICPPVPRDKMGTTKDV